jgi:ubiquinone/menaquinone biosynthesis C-methylase UbiE
MSIAQTAEIETVGDQVCPVEHVRLFDNFVRPLIHNIKSMCGRYAGSGMTVLDIGCGRGFASLGLARLVGRNGLVIAADLQCEMLEMVSRRATKAGLSGRIRTHLCQPTRIGLWEQVDFALAFWMIHETPDIGIFLKDVFDLLKTGAHFLIVEPKMHVSKDEFDDTIARACRAGFSVVRKPFVLWSRAVVLAK